MTPQELRLNEARRWLILARKDLNASRLLIAEEPAASVFHSQQAAEKTAKAFLAFHDVPFRRTHDLRELGNQCEAIDPTLSPLLEDAAGLTDYAILFRYLDAPREPDSPEAGDALSKAMHLCEAVAGLIPGAS